MPRPVSPTMRKRALGKELRRLREAAGMTTAVASAELDCSEAKVRHIENGRNVVKKVELSALVRLYGGSDVELAILEEIRKEAARPGWWSTANLPAPMQTYVGAETDASTVSVFALELVPGLLQVEDYTRELNAVAGRADVESIVQVRRKRQERLFDEEQPLILHAVCSEGVIRRLARASCAKAQFRHLLAIGERPNVTIQILPFAEGLHLSMMSGFVLLDFNPEVGIPAAYFDYFDSGSFVDDGGTVAELARRFGALRETALSPQDSFRFIEDLA